MPAIQEVQVQFLDQEDEWLPTSVFLPDESRGQRSLGSHRVRHNWATNTYTHNLKHVEHSEVLNVFQVRMDIMENIYATYVFQNLCL